MWASAAATREPIDCPLRTSASTTPSLFTAAKTAPATIRTGRRARPLAPLPKHRPRASSRAARSSCSAPTASPITSSSVAAAAASSPPSVAPMRRLSSIACRRIGVSRPVAERSAALSASSESAAAAPSATASSTTASSSAGGSSPAPASDRLRWQQEQCFACSSWARTARSSPRKSRRRVLAAWLRASSWSRSSGSPLLRPMLMQSSPITVHVAASAPCARRNRTTCSRQRPAA
mmetsp:Transcript_42475/g.140762  ORF Transcript_42475/g.140762 Transcript_42475/m.140762 type:complete len:235 (-) Transcript_42475:429-1133(-)